MPAGLRGSAVHPAARLFRQTEYDILRRRLAVPAGKALPERPGGGARVALPGGDRGANLLAHGVHGRSLALGDLPETRQVSLFDAFGEM